ncbi:MAG: helix-turn-helix domain-containing protein [Caldilineaceae bacterium]
MTDYRDNPIWLTVEEAAEHLKVSKATLYNLMKDGRLPFFYITGTRQRRLSQADLNKLLVPGDPDDLDSAGEEND